MSPHIFEITKAATFDAAHHLPAGPSGPYTRLHGHSFRVEATVRGVKRRGLGDLKDVRAHVNFGRAEARKASGDAEVFVGLHA